MLHFQLILIAIPFICSGSIYSYKVERIIRVTGVPRATLPILIYMKKLNSLFICYSRVFSTGLFPFLALLIILFFFLLFIYQARNKPADGSGHLNKQREKTPLGQKTSQQKVHPASNKPTLSSKNSSSSLNGRAATTTTGSTKQSNKNQKKKKQIYDVNVTIDLVS